MIPSSVVLSPLPFADPLLLPDVLSLLGPLPFLDHALLLQTGGALGRYSRVDAPRRLPQPLSQALGTARLPTFAKPCFAALLLGLTGRPQPRCQLLGRAPI